MKQNKQADCQFFCYMLCINEVSYKMPIRLLTTYSEANVSKAEQITHRNKSKSQDIKSYCINYKWPKQMKRIVAVKLQVYLRKTGNDL